MSAKQFIGLLNQMLKGVSIVSGETPTKESAKFIASGIYKSIGKHSIAKEFEQYCQSVYDIDILI